MQSSSADKPLVSVVLLAYNHLDITKQCVESLFRYTQDMDYELITVDNGSSDGTREYFESLPNRKKLSFPENIGVDKAVNRGLELAEGKFSLNLSNDIVATSNWLKNLVTCMESDEKIAMVVPVCGFSSNNQQVRLPYKTLDQMQQVALDWNKGNPALWEERLKLVTYTCLFRTDVLHAAGLFDEEFNPGAYDDDAISFKIRRMGYRLMLAGDTYVHHFGSVTFNAEYAKNNIAERNQALFFRKFGVDSWAASMIDFNVVRLADYRKKGPVRMLGIGRSCGSTLLQVKNIHRRAGVNDVSIDYLSETEANLPDLATICRECRCAPPSDIGKAFGGKTYDLIVVESETDKLPDAGRLYEELCAMLPPGGQLITTAVEKTFPIIREAMGKAGFALTGQINNYYFRFERS
jgi:GT2 family glycosyltransferase